MELWLEAQLQRDQNPSCPSCHINVTSIETKPASFIRLCQEGDLASVIELMKDRSLINYYDSAVLKASEGGHHQIVEKLLENGSISNVVRGLSLEAAAKNGNGELVDILFFANMTLRENIPTDFLEKALSIARAQGHRNIVEKLERLVQMRNRTCANAARGGHLELLQWARANDCPWNMGTCEAASTNGHLKVLAWAIDNGCPGGENYKNGSRPYWGIWSP